MRAHRPGGITKLRNEYQSVLPYFGDIPKAALAAIAVSFVSCGGDRLDEAADAIAEEWWALHEAGILTRRPSVPRPVRKEETEAG